MYRSERLTERGEKVVVWRAPEHGRFGAEVWAPELHRLDGRWYIYVAASNGKNETHRMIVLEAVGDQPTSAFRFKSELYTGDELAAGKNSRWAIDGTVLELAGQRHLLWSGWEDERDEQWLYIATMSNPWTVSSNRVRLCANNDYLWERVDETGASRGLNEGPQVLRRNGRVFVVYSASASWAPSYKLGMLELMLGGDPMNPLAWRKRPEPVLQANDRAWGVGHNCFVRSPDGAEDWLVFHAKLEMRHNWNRAIHVQRFTWDASGAPVFGEPVGAGRDIPCPSGEVARPDSDTEPALEVALGRGALLALGEQPVVESVKVLDTGGQ